MPKPSKQRTTIGLACTAALFLIGAWFASGISSNAEGGNETGERRAYIPAPVTGLAEPGSPSAFKEN